MVSRFAELWLVQGYRDYDFDHAVEQLSLICANALRHPEDAEMGLVEERDRAGSRDRHRSVAAARSAE